MRYFTLKSKAEVEALEKEFADNPQQLKLIIAEELTIRIHGEEAYQGALNVSQLMFQKTDKSTLLALGEKDLETIAIELQDNTYNVSKNTIESGVNIIDLIAEHTQIVNSKGDARRAIKGNAIAVNKDKVGDFDFNLTAETLLFDKYLLVENGRKNKFMLVFE